MATIREQLQSAMVDDLVTADQVALICKYSTPTILRKAKKGEIPGVVRFGNSVRFRRVVVFWWMRHNKKGSHLNED